MPSFLDIAGDILFERIAEVRDAADDPSPAAAVEAIREGFFAVATLTGETARIAVGAIAEQVASEIVAAR